MTREEAFKLLIQAINRIQQLSGREIVQITPDTFPVGDLPGFDSANGLELTCELSENLSIEIPLDENILVSKNGNRALTVGEVAIRICGIVNKAEE